MIVFNLPRPPSTNRLYKLVLNARGKRPYTKEYSAWHERAAWEIATQRIGQQKRIEGRYTLTLIVEPCKIDLGNAEKSVSDLLQHMQVIANDKLCDKIELKWGDIKGCRVELSEATSNSSLISDGIERSKNTSPRKNLPTRCCGCASRY